MSKDLRFYTDSDGRTQVSVAASEAPQDGLCDFCSTIVKPFKLYSCREFTDPIVGCCLSNGSWAACASCAALIDANDRYGLAERSALMFAMDGMDLPDAKEMLLALQERFFENRIDIDTNSEIRTTNNLHNSRGSVN